MPPVDLILWENDLDTVGIIRTRNRVLENADGADNFAFLNDADFTALLVVNKVARIANDLFGLDSFGSAAHANNFAIRIGDNLMNRFVKHVGAAINGGEARKGLRQLAKAIKGIDVWRFAVTCHGRSIKYDALVGRAGGLIDVTDNGLSAIAFG
jgi:hypothetical protein